MSYLHNKIHNTAQKLKSNDGGTKSNLNELFDKLWHEEENKNCYFLRCEINFCVFKVGVELI